MVKFSAQFFEGVKICCVVLVFALLLIRVAVLPSSSSGLEV